jgi:ubiquinone/menaquinone biosynthesis C-methylase UbiE
MLRVCLFISDSLHADILAFCLGDIYAVHFGIDRFLRDWISNIVWHSLFSDCSNFDWISYWLLFREILENIYKNINACNTYEPYENLSETLQRFVDKEDIKILY